MKKFIFATLAAMLTLAIFSCNDITNTPTSDDDGVTNVLYSADGKVTIYLEGNAPNTAANRALSKPLAQVATNFYEVVFSSGGTTVRASWSPGESAAIKGVPRVDYGTDLTGSDQAVLFAGRKSDKTLLAIGFLSGGTEANGSASVPGEINTTTVAVTFELNAFVGGSIASSYGVADDATLATAAIYGTSYPAIKIAEATDPDTPSDMTGTITYTLDNVDNSISGYLAGIDYTVGDAKAYLIAPNISLSNTLIDVPAPLLLSTTGNTLPITFTSGVFEIKVIPVSDTVGGSISSFYFEAPVYAINDDPGAGTPPTPAVKWFIRPSYGINLRVLDDNKTNSPGGSMLVIYGEPSSDYIVVTGVYP